MTYKDITINKFNELKEIVNEGGDDLVMQSRLIAAVNDMSEDEVLALPLAKYSELVKTIDFLKEQPDVKPHAPKNIVIKGKKYNVITDPRKLSAGQYIDFQNLIQMDDPDKYLPNLIACFVEPEGKNYGEYDVMEVADIIGENMSIEEGLALTGFFLLLYHTSIRTTLHFLVRKIRKMERKEKDPEQKEKLRIAIQKIQEMEASLKGGLTSFKLSK